MFFLLYKSVGLEQTLVCLGKKLVAAFALASALGDLRLVEEPSGTALQALRFLVDVGRQRPEESCTAVADNPII
jgi:hypothetical protein